MPKAFQILRKRDIDLIFKRSYSR